MPAPPYQHLIGSQAPIAVQVDALEPIIKADIVCFVLLTEDEVHEIFISHLALRLAGKWAGCLQQTDTSKLERDMKGKLLDCGVMMF